MTGRRFLNLVLLAAVIASVLIGGSGQVLASAPPPPAGGMNMQKPMSNADRKAAGVRVAKARKQAGGKAAAAIPGTNTKMLGPKAPAVAAAGPTGTSAPLAMPDYFGNVPNYANSPLPISVSIQGDGSGAFATATVNPSGAVGGFTVVNAGSSYTSPPTVALSGGGGSGATATAYLAPAPVGGFTVNAGGSGYTSAPLVHISGGGGSGATATATLGPGSIGSVAVTNSGRWYTSAPGVVFTGGGGSGATATAVVASGTVTAVNVTNGGSGYTSAPTLTFSGGGGSGATANATVASPVASVTLTTAGSGYRTAPAVSFSGGGGSDAASTAQLGATGVGGLTVTAGGSGYTSAPTVSFSGGGGTGATATATLGGNGTVGGFTLISGGTDYTIANVVVVGGGGSGATGTATIDPTTGAITSIVVANAGSGYGTVPGIRKFVDGLPLLGSTPNDLGQYLPVAVPDTAQGPSWQGPAADYYEIAVIQYTQKLHADLPATTLRGYVQIETPAQVSVSNHVPLFYPDGVTRIVNATGNPVFAVDYPQYLGPVIVAQKDRPVRIKFDNYLPKGTGGDLFIPVDNTVMGAGMGPDGMNSYSQNRATLHLHGGVTPWISDGTPHQWTTPAGATEQYPKGVSVRDVPDMAPAGDGSMTFYYTNQQSARLMFYHDHTYGITRLNVYAGEAAGYVVQDPYEATLVNGGTIPGTTTSVRAGTIPADQVPLVIEDKTFVPSPTQLAAEDPSWDVTAYGGYGNLWFPHVYMTNQNPGDSNGANAMGRWDYGPWFWPPFTIVNGQVSNPKCTTSGVQSTCPPGENAFNPGIPNPTIVPEAFMDTMTVNGTAYPKVVLQPKAYRFRILNASNDRTLNLQLYQAGTETNGAFTPCNGDAWTGTTLNNNGCSGEVPMVPAVHDGAGTAGYVYPDELDGRDGGVPDSRAAGPSFIQIGTEGGFLSKPVVHPNRPVGYNYNRRDIVVLNVSTKTLFLGPAERADVIVDLSTVPPGSNLILYNDSPAPVPAFDSRYDYYTGDPDQVMNGGAPTTLPGYGPNTRTIMQIQVGTTAPVPYISNNYLTDLNAGIPAAYGQVQAAPVVPEQGYDQAFGTTSPADPYIRIQDEQTTFVPGGVTGGTPVTLALQPKGIQELFDPFYGRMNATMSVEIPNTNGTDQTTIPYGYIDPPTELIDTNASDALTGATPYAMLPDGTQIWKFTHNGVDTHAVHFHMFNVELINRVGWDGMIRPPDANEMGWKDTVRMNPLEDALVAIKPIVPVLPWSLPNSIRPLDVTMALGTSGEQYTNVNPLGNSVTVVNHLVNFGWEYVFHCHLLGHEENDMMRAMAFGVAPAAPSIGTATAGTGRVTVTFRDNSINETRFTVQRQPSGGPWTNAGTVDRPAPTPNLNGSVNDFGLTTGDVLIFTDTGVAAGTKYVYRVTANDVIGDTATTGYPSLSVDSVPSATSNAVTP